MSKLNARAFVFGVSFNNNNVSKYWYQCYYIGTTITCRSMIVLNFHPYERGLGKYDLLLSQHKK